MTEDDTVIVAVRMPKHLNAWLEEKREALKKEEHIDVSIQTIVKQQLEIAKRIDETAANGPRGPKKARPHT